MQLTMAEFKQEMIMWLRDRFEDALVYCGVGGFYRHETFVRLNDDKITITGPFQKRSHARGVDLSLYFYLKDVRFHLKPPPNSIHLHP